MRVDDVRTLTTPDFIGKYFFTEISKLSARQACCSLISTAGVYYCYRPGRGRSSRVGNREFAGGAWSDIVSTTADAQHYLREACTGTWVETQREMVLWKT